MAAGDEPVAPLLGARRTSVADLRAEVERLTEALALAEERRRTAERTLADVAQMAAADAADLRARLAELQARPDAASTPPAPAPPAPAAAGSGRPRATPWRRGRRVLLLAGLVLGVALIADGLLTIFWQEPLTALQQSHDQAALRHDLGRLRERERAAPKVAKESSATRMRRQARALLTARADGKALGSVSIPKIGLKTVFVEATTHDSLKKGPGHYRGTVLPGMTGTVGLAGHRTTYGAPFRRVDELVKGSRIVVRMPYGTFTYKVTGTRITTPDDASSLVSHAGTDKLVLTACHPLYSAAKRIVVSARLASSTPA
ncbi:MAG TPA: class E sortase [Baekduia sp.]|uniref:class E sortase n=1 Tax=Baekduia sp. TaxID=2600305 RepID=UPI002D77DAD6|nr:class E sortase [Baekduia sp.]HET6505275.1 class E sortase [Baekduia sp.]